MAKKKINHKDYYKNLTKNYTEFKPITDEVYRNLSRSQQERIRDRAKWFREDIRQLSTEDFNSLPQEIRAKNMEHVRDILSGAQGKRDEAQYLENYKKGIELLGDYSDYGDYFEYVFSKLRANEKRQFMAELPDLYLLYKDKDRSHRKRSDRYDEDIAIDQFGAVMSAIENVVEARQMQTGRRYKPIKDYQTWLEEGDDGD